MTVIAYPGPAVRAVPAFTCTCPAGWTAAEAAGALVVVRPPTGAPGATGVGGELVAEVRIETVRVPATARLAEAERIEKLVRPLGGFDARQAEQLADHAQIFTARHPAEDRGLLREIADQRAPVAAGREALEADGAGRRA